MRSRMSRRLRSSVRSAPGVVFAAAILLLACGPTPSPAVSGPLPLPFAVSDYFAPTGYEGDGANVEDVNLVTMVIDACPSRSPNPIGDCYSVQYEDGAVQA